ncbi:hypothetical protein ACFZAI_10305 [Achromobacter sp. NPDC008082]|uniref:hypothetical protein n=1 Tax=Achromobacter sp. NPDC008082 TaxID=3363888 RepID=UPI0036EE2444
MLAMIPVSLPSANFFLLLSLGFLTGIVLVGWAVVLAVSASHRRSVRKHWKKSAVLFVVLALPAAFFVWVNAVIWQVEREGARREAARHVTLDQPTTVAGTLMPAGTRLSLQDEGQPETYVEAEFPQPVEIFGVQAMRARRHLGTDYDDTYAVRGRYPQTVFVSGKGEQTVQGWQCDATQEIEFDTTRDGAMKALRQCQLGHGNQIGELALASGSVVFGSDGTVYTDGSSDPDRWRVEVKHSVAVQVFGLMVSAPRLYLDADRRLIRVSDTELACKLDLGGFHYPPGTQVKTVRRGDGAAREPFPGIFVFSPWDGQAAKRDGHDDVPEGMSVMQAFDGTLVGIVTNDSAGVFKFAKFVVEGDKAVEPPRARCP